MMNRRALVPLDDLRRWAKVASEQGVSIRGQRSPDGTVTIVINPGATVPIAPAGDDLDAAITGYLTS